MSIVINPDIIKFEKESHCFVYNRQTKKEYRIGETEKIFLNKIYDKEIDLNNLTEYNDIKLISTINSFLKIGLLIDENKKTQKKIFPIKIRLFDYKKIRKIKYIPQLYPLFLACGGLLIIIDLFLLLTGHPIPTAQIEKISQNQNLFLIIESYLFLFVSVLVHECGHGFIAKKFGCEIVECGLMISIIPCVYIHIIGMSDCSKKQKIHIYSWGIVSNIFLALILLLSAIIFNHCNFVELSAVLCTNIITIILVSAFDSLNYFKFDGKKMIGEILNEKNYFSVIKSFLLSSTKKENFCFGCLIITNVAFVMLSMSVQNVAIFLICNVLVMSACHFLFPSNKNVMAYSSVLSVSSLFGVVPITYRFLENGISNTMVSVLVYFVLSRAIVVWITYLYFLINEKLKGVK